MPTLRTGNKRAKNRHERVSAKVYSFSSTERAVGVSDMFIKPHDRKRFHWIKGKPADDTDWRLE